MNENNSSTTASSLAFKDTIAAVCFFASGFIGLSYEICWIRKASLVFGATTFAVSTVFAVFFAGLALGSYIFGKRSQKTSQPLKIYAYLEIGLGVFVLLIPWLFVWAEKLYGLFYPSIMHSFALLSTVRFTLLTLIILPPTILMGGTLPLFCRQYVVKKTKISLSVGLLYGLNTAGAALGCIVCGFWLIPNLGVNKTIWFGGMLNILVGLIVWSLRISASEPAPDADGSETAAIDDRTETSSTEPSSNINTTGRDTVTIFTLFFLSGFTALGNEILWTRYLSLIIHNTVYTYTLTLGITLIGIVLGSVAISGFSDRTHRRALLFGAVHVLNGIIILTVLLLPAWCWKDVINSKDLATHLWIFCFLFLLPAVLSGISFPLAIRMVVERPRVAGIGVGKMTAINTFGGIIGSLAIGFLVLPQIGLHNSLLLTTAASLLIGFMAWLLLDRSLRLFEKFLAVALGLAIWIAVPFITGTNLPADFLSGENKLIDYKEGLNAHLAVIENEKGTLILTIDRMWQGEDRKNQQIMAAHVPTLLHSDPKDVCVVGLGVGQTANRFLLYDVNQVDCVDIERDLVPLVRKHYDSSWMDDNRFHCLIEDGRNYLTHTDRKYDIISIEVGQIFRPGLASFYTSDFYRTTRNKLKKDGIICQYVGTSFFGTKEFRAVIRSFLEIFPQSVLWYNTSEFLLIGSVSDRIGFSGQRLDVLHSDDVINNDLRFAYWGGPAHWLNKKEIFLAGFLCGPDTLAKLCAGADLYRDDRPVLEYAAVSDETVSPEPILDLLERHLDPPSVVFSGKLDDESVSLIDSTRRLNLQDIMAQSFLTGKDDQDKVASLKKAIQFNPHNLTANYNLGVTLLELGRAGEALDSFSNALRIDPGFKDAHNNKGYALALLGRTTDAIEHYLEALRIDPDFVDAMNNLGVALLMQRRAGEAIQHFSRALELMPDHVQVRINMGNALAENGRLEEAAEQYRQAIRIDPTSVNALNNLGIALFRMGRIDDAISRFQEALRIKPDYQEAWKNLKSALQQKQQKKKRGRS